MITLVVFSVFFIWWVCFIIFGFPEPHSQIQGIAYDSVDDALYWTSDDGGSLMWYRSAWMENRGKVLHQFENARLQGIAIDACDR